MMTIATTVITSVYLWVPCGRSISCSPQCNGKTLGVTGSSQGGALSMVTAALDKRGYVSMPPFILPCATIGHIYSSRRLARIIFTISALPRNESKRQITMTWSTLFAELWYRVGSVGNLTTTCVLLLPHTLLLQQYHRFQGTSSLLRNRTLLVSRAIRTMGANGCGSKWDYKQKL